MDGEHIGIPALARQVFLHPAIVAGVDPVLGHLAVELRSSRTVGAEECLQREFGVVPLPLSRSEQALIHTLLDLAGEGADAEGQEGQHLLFQARSPVAPLVGLANHPGRHPEPSANLDHAMLSRLQQLSIDRIDADGFRCNPLFQNRRSSGVHRARYGLHILPELLPLRRLENAVNLEGDRG